MSDDSGDTKDKFPRPFADAYAKYQDCGYSPIPNYPPGYIDVNGVDRSKSPCFGDNWRDLAKRLITPEEIHSVMSRVPYAHIGVMFGYNNLIGIDLDTIDRKLQKLILSVLPADGTLRIGDKRKAGMVFYRAEGFEEIPHRSYKGLDGEVIVEILGRTQAVVPPSVHPSGSPYRYLQIGGDGVLRSTADPIPVWELPVFTPSDMRRLAAALDPYLKHGTRDYPDTSGGPEAPDLINSPAAVAAATRYLQTASVSIEGRGGHNNLIKVINRLADFGVIDSTAVELLVMSGWNSRCEPPWSIAELRKHSSCVHLASRKSTLGHALPEYAARLDLAWVENAVQGGADDAGGEGAGDSAEEPFVRAQEWSGGAAPAGGDDPCGLFGGAGAESQEQGAKTSRFTPVPQDEFIRSRFNRAEELWVVDRLFPLEGVAAIYGESGSKKSFIALDLVEAIAAGEEWCGRETTQGPVVYIAAEGQSGLAKRMAAYYQYRNLPQEGDGRPVSIIPVAPNLGGKTNDDHTELGHAIKKEIPNPRIIVIDTLAQTLGDGEENTTGMAKFVQNAQHLSDYFKCLVVVIHHTGWTEKDRLRGGSTLIGALVVSVLCEKGNLTWKKQKDEDGDIAIDMTYEKITLALDKRGNPITSLVITDRVLKSSVEAEQTHEAEERTRNEFDTKTLMAVAHGGGKYTINEIAMRMGLTAKNNGKRIRTSLDRLKNLKLIYEKLARFRLSPSGVEEVKILRDSGHV